METTTCILFSHWVSYLINGDASGLDESEQEEIDNYIEKEGLGACVDVSEESWFARRNDASNLGGTIAQYTFYV